MLSDDRLLVVTGQYVTTCLRNLLTEVLICRVKDTILDTIFNRIKGPDVVTGDADFSCLIGRIEGNPVDYDALPFGTCDDPRSIPIEDHDFRVHFVRHRNDNVVIVLQGREVEIDDNFGLGLRGSASS